MKNLYPLTHPQLGRWYAEKIFSGTSIGNVGGLLLLKGEIDYELLQKAVNIFIEQNDGCRIRIREAEGEPKQYLSEHFPRSFDYVDFSDTADPEEAGKWCDQQMRMPLPLTDCDLFYFALVRITPTEGGFFSKFHHLISDAWSMALLGNQVIEHYTNLVENNKIESKIKPSYLDWVKTQEEYLHSKRFEKSRQFWNEQFNDLPEPTTLKPHAEIILNTDAKRKTFELTKQQTAALEQYCHSEGCSMFGTLLSAFSVYVNSVTGQNDMVIATMTLNRTSLIERNIVGMFAGTVPLRIAIDDNLTFKDFAKENQKKWMSFIRHQGYPYDILLEDVRAKHRTNRILHNIVFSYQNVKFARKNGVEDFKHSWIFNGHSADSLIINVNDREGEGRLVIDYDYQTELFTEDEILNLHDNLIAIISDAIENSESSFKDLQSLKTEDMQRLRGEYQEQKAQINVPDKETIPVKIAATFTSEPIEDYITWWGKQFGYNCKVEFAGYNQVFQELLDPKSLLAGNKEGINVILVRFEDFIRDDHGNDEDKATKLEKVYTDLIEAIGQLTNTVPLILGLFPVSTHLGLSNEIQDTIKILNYRLAKDMESYRHVYLLNLSDVQDHYLVEDIFDEWKDREGHMPFTDEYYAAIGTEVARKIIAIKKQHFKVIVVDCDNTLWNGICGEVGTLGVQVKDGYLALQALLIEKHDEGFLLAICSKNNEADVWEVFEQNSGMLLKREHIVSWRINWQEKCLNIREIAQELNLGLDSFVFIDDNPLECAKMVEECPEVLTLQLPESEQDIPVFLQHVWAFDRARVTKEDTERSSMYAAEQQRTSMKFTALSLDEFLKGLDLKVSMRLLQAEEIERAAQLTQRTNQFNLSTVRRNEQEIQKLMHDDQYACFITEAADRFGDYGIVGLVILKSCSNDLFIDTLLMSCRVLGRRVEDVVLSGIRRYAEEQGKPLIQARYVPTKKNQLILEFIETNGWSVAQKDGIVTEYTASVADLPEKISFISFYYNEHYPATLEQQIAETVKNTVVLDHLAIATEDLEDCGHYYSRLGYSQINFAMDQNSLLSIYESEKYVPLEFVAPVDKTSPSYNLVESVGEAPYHLCFKVPNIQEFFASLSDVKFEVISKEKPAILFDGKPVAFIMVHQVGLIELLETGVYESLITPGFNSSTIRMVVGDSGNAISLFKLLGYVQVRSSRDSNHNIILTMIGLCREKLELIIPQSEQSEAFQFMSERGAGVFQLVFDIDKELTKNNFTDLKVSEMGDLIDNGRRYNVFIRSEQKQGIILNKTVAQYNTDQLEKTRHYEYLFPVKYMTGEALLKLPVYENTNFRTREYQAPGNEIEELLVRIWEEVLKVEHIGINDTFFELGGDSLKVLRVMTKLIAHGWKLSVKDFFTYPTVKQLSDVIKGKAELNDYKDKERTFTAYPECIPHQINAIYLSANKVDLGNVLLTGATGFLGAHLLDELVSLTDSIIYCLVRGQNSNHARQRLIESLQYYFPGKRGEIISDRVVVISGDCSQAQLGLSNNQYQVLGDTINTVIHSAALVKFYGVWEEFKVTNVTSTKNIINFCCNHNIRLAHISTESISGNHLVEQNLQDVVFTENDFYVGQNYLGNQYVRSKFESELAVLQAISEGLIGQIFRMGIITGRHRDGHFQSNINDNAQYNRIKFLIDIGIVPEDLLMQDVQFTPVDLASRAVIMLMQERGTWGKVFHLYNNRFSTIRQLLQAAETLNFIVDITDYDTFSSRLRAISADPKRKDLITKIIPDLTSEFRLDFEDNITMDNTITCKYLEQLGFEWPNIDNEYLIKVLSYMMDQGFIGSSKNDFEDIYA